MKMVNETLLYLIVVPCMLFEPILSNFVTSASKPYQTFLLHDTIGSMVYVCLISGEYIIIKCFLVDMAPPRPPLPHEEGVPMRPPPPETDDEDDVFKHAPNSSQPIMVN